MPLFAGYNGDRQPAEIDIIRTFQHRQRTRAPNQPGWLAYLVAEG